MREPSSREHPVGALRAGSDRTDSDRTDSDRTDSVRLETERPDDARDLAEASRRMERFARTKDPGALWPGLTEPARVAAAREIERVTRAVLAGETRVPIDPSGAHDAYALAIAGHTTGMGPLLGRWMEDGFIVAAPAVVDRFAHHLSHARARAARMERGVLPALDAILARGITPVVLKGFHTGRVYFEEPAVRRLADVDLLVPPERVDDAEAALGAVGFRPETPALRPYRRDWIGPAVDPRLYSVELSDARSKWTIELHASLDRIFHPGAVARLDAERARVEPLHIAGRPLLALSPPILLLTLACHCSQELDGVRLLRLVELVCVIRTEQATNRFDWDDFLAMLRRTRAAHFAYPALALAEDLAPGTVDARVLDAGWRASTWAARHTVPRLAPAGGSLDDRGVIRQLMWTRGPLALLQRVLRTFWPASFLEPRDVVPGWRVRLRRLRAGVLSLRAPDERRSPPSPPVTPDRSRP